MFTFISAVAGKLALSGITFVSRLEHAFVEQRHKYYRSRFSLQKHDARIIFANSYQDAALKVACEVKKTCIDSGYDRIMFPV